jgi:hypothetical protein
MESLIYEIQESLYSGNFQVAAKLSSQWLEGMTISSELNPEVALAQEAYLYARYFGHRQERFSKLPIGETRARAFLHSLEEIKQLRQEKKFDKNDTVYFDSLKHYIYLQIAEGFARAFAGQKSYNLNDQDIIQLAIALLKLEKWKSALETLVFLQRLKKSHSLTHLLLSFAYYNLKDEKEFYLNLREALFQKPELIAEYMEFIPGGIFQKLWLSLEDSEGSQDYRFRNYALLLEINGIYKYRRSLPKEELDRLEVSFEEEYRKYKSKTSEKDDLLPLILHKLVWMILAYKESGTYEKLEEYRNIMINLSPDTWASFQEKNFNE